MTKNIALGVGTAKRLAGAPLRDALLAQVGAAVAGLALPPKIAVVLPGDDPESALYVRHKMRAAEQVGLAAVCHTLDGTDEAALHRLLDALADNASVTGILLQLPLPDGWDTDAALARIPVLKDCDGLSSATTALRLAGDFSATLPATPLGVMRLLAHIGQPIAGVPMAVVGQGRVAGKPMAEMLAAAGAIVTVIDRHTPAPAALAREAEVLIPAAGKPGLVTADWVKPGAVVVDIGLTRRDGLILGDAAPDVADVAGWLTPVPGGVGPMTIATLTTNAVDGARRANGLEGWAWAVPPVA